MTFKLELTLDAVKRRLIEHYNKDLEKACQLLDKDYKIWYNSYTQTLVLEHREYDKTFIKSSPV